MGTMIVVVVGAVGLDPEVEVGLAMDMDMGMDMDGGMMMKGVVLGAVEAGEYNQPNSVLESVEFGFFC